MKSLNTHKKKWVGLQLNYTGINLEAESFLTEKKEYKMINDK